MTVSATEKSLVLPRPFDYFCWRQSGRSTFL